MFPKSTPIITKCEFFQVILQIFRVVSMMGASEPGFEISYCSMYPRENLTCSFTSTLNFWPMFITQTLQAPITIPAISVDLAAGNNISANEGINRLLGNILDYTQTDSSSMIPSVFNSNNYWNLFFGATTTPSFSRSSESTQMRFISRL